MPGPSAFHLPQPAAWRWLAASLVLLALLLHGQFAHAAATSPMRFQRVDALGPDQASTLSLLQDRQGFIWIGTNNNGLYRFDGYHLTAYRNRPNSANSLPNDRVSALFEDAAGTIWAGTQNGLARFNPGSGDFTRFAPASRLATSKIIKSIVADGAGGLWLATWGGLQHFDPRSATFTGYEHSAADPASIASDDINAVARDRQGGVWVATWPGGLDYLAPGAKAFTHYRIDRADQPDAKLNIARSLHIDAQQALWVGTENGVVRWQAGTDWERRERLASPASRVTYLYSDREGSVWAATLSAGLLRWAPGAREPQAFRHRGNDPFSLPSNDIRAVLHDRAGMLWAASYTDGIALGNLNSRGFTRFIPFDAETVESEPDNSLQSIAGAAKGLLWLSGNTGVSLFDPASGRVLQHYRGGSGKGALSSDIAYSLYAQPGGPLWVGTSLGLNRLDPATGAISVVHFGSVANDYINTITPGRDGLLWLGTGNSMIRYQPASGAYRVYVHDAAVAGSRNAKSTNAILQDRRGRVWAGSAWTGGGLDLLDADGEHFRHFLHSSTDSATLSDDNIAVLFEDEGGRLWAGTGKGLDELVTAADGSITVRRVPGLSGAGGVRIEAIRSDARGMLWLATANGLIRFDSASGATERFLPPDGLTEGFAGASYRAPDGVLYFGGSKGMTAVHPEQVQRRSVAPLVALTDISIFNRSILAGALPPQVQLSGPAGMPEALTLPPAASVFSIEFAALDFAAPAANRYAYRLQGFDQDWVPTDAAHRHATYTNLDPGTYRFEVKASNERAQWSEKTVGMDITILPPFWKAAWFRALAALSAAALLFLAYRWRVGSLTRQTVRLEALVATRFNQLLEQQQVNRDATVRLKAILQNAADAIITTDDQGRIESCNRAGERIYGWSDGQMAGMSFLTLTDGDGATVQAVARARTALDSEEQVDLEMQHRHADGSAFTAELSMRRFPDAGQQKYIIVVRDITARKRTERLKTEFISTVSHELRTPLTAIRGGLSLVANGVVGAIPPGVAQLVHIALASAERLTRLINDLLDVQKIEAGMLSLTLRQLPLRALVETAIASHQDYARRHDVRLLLDGAVPDWQVRVDVDRFAQVLDNLFSNACKYSPKQEAVRVRINLAGDDQVRIEVADHGPGIPTVFRERIFQKFSQADASDTRAKEGSGLGLSIAKELVEQMGGGIGYVCPPEGGTVFWIVLPVVIMAAEETIY
ncbi:MAG: two-component regulator propeller domain-containing protein [Pseudomonadota bacterium]